MTQLPQSTIYGKRMPKEKFYSHLELSPAVKRSFVNDVDYFVWQNKLSPTTINIEEGERVKEIAIFNVYLKGESYAPEVFEVIDRNVPVYVLYVLHYDSKVKLLASYKEPNASKFGSFKIVRTFVSDWLNNDDISLQLEGLNLDVVYENFVRQIAGAKLQECSSESIVEDIAEQQRKEKIEREIAQLQAKKRKEKQFNKQIAISAEIKKLKDRYE
ncbi:MAG: DUF4391 domain-containing protein [bacterium]